MEDWGNNCCETSVEVWRQRSIDLQKLKLYIGITMPLRIGLILSCVLNKATYDIVINQTKFSREYMQDECSYWITNTEITFEVKMKKENSSLVRMHAKIHYSLICKLYACTYTIVIVSGLKWIPKCGGFEPVYKFT